MTPIQKLRIAFLAMALVLCLGTAGFMTLEGLTPLDALYLTVTTLSTVGYGDMVPRTTAGEVFVIFLILFGVAAAGFTVSVIGQVILEGQFHEHFGRRKMKTKINKMTAHSIIAGYGRVGRQVAQAFDRRKAPFVVIEKNETALMKLQDAGYLFVEGEGTDDDVLRSAGIETARTLISTLPDEAQNVYLTLTARDMNPALKIIARADVEGGEKKLMRVGADHVVSPHVLGGQRMAMATLRPNIVDFMHATDLDEGGPIIEELVIPAGYHLIGKSLIESNFKREYGVHIIGIKRAGELKMTIGPGPNTVFQEGDVLVLIGTPNDLERLGRKLR